MAQSGTVPALTHLLTLPQTKLPMPSCPAPLAEATAGPARPAAAAGVLGAPRLARLVAPPASGMVSSC